MQHARRRGWDAAPRLGTAPCEGLLVDSSGLSGWERSAGGGPTAREQQPILV
jgi:hypothetical protein